MNILPIASHSVNSNFTKSQSFKGVEKKDDPNLANVVLIGGGGRIGKNYLYSYIWGKHLPVNYSTSSQAATPNMKKQNIVAINMGSMGLKNGATIANVSDEDLLANITNDSVLPVIPPTVKLSINRADGKTFLQIQSRRGGKENIELVATRDTVDFSEHKPDILVNATGAKPELTSDGFRKYKAASGIGAEGYAVLSAPSKESVKDDSERPFGEKNMPLVVSGVTDRTPELKEKMFEKIHAAGNIVSGASCTTNGSAVVTDILNRYFGVQKGVVETVHAVTSTQSTADKTKDVADSKNRNPFDSIIPTTTGAAKALAKTVPDIKSGTLDGTAWRVPTSDGSLAVINVLLNKQTSAEEVNAVLQKEAAKKQNKFLLGIAPKNSTSKNVVGNPIRDLVNIQATKVIGGDFAHVESYYDNEWGYTLGLGGLTATLAGAVVAAKSHIAKIAKAVIK